MKSQHFLQWMDDCDFRFAADVERALGLSRNSAARYVKIARSGHDLDLPPYIALAMTAIAHGLDPWAGKE